MFHDTTPRVRVSPLSHQHSIELVERRLGRPLCEVLERHRDRGLNHYFGLHPCLPATLPLARRQGSQLSYSGVDDKYEVLVCCVVSLAGAADTKERGKEKELDKPSPAHPLAPQPTQSTQVARAQHIIHHVC